MERRNRPGWKPRFQEPKPSALRNRMNQLYGIRYITNPSHWTTTNKC